MVSTLMIRCLVPDFPTADDLLPYLRCLDQSRQYTNFGSLIQAYEALLAEMNGGHCVTLSSGTIALELAIAALKLPAASKVLLPSFTFPATVLAVLRSGLIPVFSDVDEINWTLTPEIAIGALNAHRFSLILPVATFGLSLPSDAWDDFTQETGIAVLIDAAAALESQRIGKTTHAVFSLHATKPLGIGEGGLLISNDRYLVDRVRCLSNFGFDRGKVCYPAACNAKLSEYSAAVGLAQLARRSSILERRRFVWASYRKALQDIPNIDRQPFDDWNPPAVFSVRLKKEAEKVSLELAKAQIETRCWYVPPLHHHVPFVTIERVGRQKDNSLEVTEYLSRYCLGLPFHAFLSEDEVWKVADKIQNILIES